MSWNLIVDLTSLTLLVKSSACETGVGNLPAAYRAGIIFSETIEPDREIYQLPLDRPGPKRRGICLIKASDDKKASYFLASFYD